MVAKRSKTLLACMIALVLIASTAAAHPPQEDTEESADVAPIFLLADDEGLALGHDLRDGSEDAVAVWFESGSSLYPTHEYSEPAYLEFDRLVGAEVALADPAEVPAFFAIQWGYENYDPLYEIFGDHERPVAVVTADLVVGCTVYDTLHYELPARYGHKVIEDVFTLGHSHEPEEAHNGSASGGSGGGFHPEEQEGGHSHGEAHPAADCEEPWSHDVALRLTVEPIFEHSFTNVYGEFVYVELGLAGSSGVLLDRAPEPEPAQEQQLELVAESAEAGGSAGEPASESAPVDDTVEVPAPGAAWVLPALGVGALLRRRK